MSNKSRLLELAWEKPAYAPKSQKQHSQAFWSNPSLVRLYFYTRLGHKILDCGCGDGRVLQTLWHPDARFFGLEISSRGVASAQRRFSRVKNVTIKKGDLERFYYRSIGFDIVYSCYVLEHVDNPELVISNMIARLNKNGLLILICPNYGSPLEYSPGSPLPNETLASRAFTIFINSFKSPANKLRWRRVTPPVFKTKTWTQDSDVTCEPYVLTLKGFLKARGISILEISSRISGISGGPGLLGFAKKFCLLLGQLKIPPFTYFGPTLFIVGRKI